MVSQSEPTISVHYVQYFHDGKSFCGDYILSVMFSITLYSCTMGAKMATVGHEMHHEFQGKSWIWNEYIKLHAKMIIGKFIFLVISFSAPNHCSFTNKDQTRFQNAYKLQNVQCQNYIIPDGLLPGERSRCYRETFSFFLGPKASYFRGLTLHTLATGMRLLKV